MDYKYIEQLLERYWDCRTSVEEEEILRAFFSQQNLPAGLAKYRSLFAYQREEAQKRLGDDFDARLLAAIGEPAAPAAAAADTGAAPALSVPVRRITLAGRLRPLFRAAAAVAIVTLLGTAAQHSFTTSPTDQTGGWDYNQSAYKDSYADPQKAFEASMKTLRIFKEGAQTAVNDSAHHAGETAPAAK